MSRLTTKIIKDVAYITSSANIIEIPDLIEGHKYTGEAILKLGLAEDLEEEYDMDFASLCKKIRREVKNNKVVEPTIYFDDLGNFIDDGYCIIDEVL